MQFKKYHGAGNDFILMKTIKGMDPEALAKKVCHRHFGIGADGLMYPGESEGFDIKMTYLNSDGSKATMCGNGLRCFSRFVYEEGLVKKEVFTVETDAGPYDVQVNLDNDMVKSVTVDMGTVDFDPSLIPVEDSGEVIEKTIEINGESIEISSLFFGVPHTVVFQKELKASYLLDVGPKVEKHPLFIEGTNVNFVQVVDRDHLLVDTWERGAGHTMACGTGVCASVAVAKHLNKVGDKVVVNVPGGVIEVTIENGHLIMTGGATEICLGNVNIDGL